MADDTSVEVRIIGSLDSSLQTSAAAAKAQLDELAQSSGTVRISAAEMAAALQATGNNLSHVTPEMVGLGGAAISTAAATENMAANSIQAAAAAETLGHGTAGVTREVIVLAHEMVQGRFSRIPGSLMVLTSRMGGLSLATLGWGAAVAVAAGGLGYLEYEALVAQKQLDDLGEAFNLTGRGAQFTAETIQYNLQFFSELPGVTREASAAFMQFASVHAEVNSILTNQVGQLLPAFVQAYGEKAPQAAGKLLSALSDLTEDGFRKLDSELLNLSPTEYETIENLIQTGQTAQAVSRILADLSKNSGVYIKSLGDQVYDIKTEMTQLKEVISVEGLVGGDVAGDLVKLHALETALASIRKQEAQAGQQGADTHYKQQYKDAETLNQSLDKQGQITKQIATYQNDLNEARKRGDTVGAAQFTSAIANEQAKLTEIQISDNEKVYRSFIATEDAKAAAFKSGSAQRIVIDEQIAAKAAQLFGTESTQYQQAMAREAADRRGASDQESRDANAANKKFLQGLEQTENQVRQILQRDVSADNARSQSALANKKRDLDAAVALRQMSAGKELQILVGLYSDEADLEIAALKAHQQANASDVQTYNDDAQKILSIYRRLFNDINKLQHDSDTKQMSDLDRTVKEYEKKFRPVTQGFNQMFRGMLSGQQTFGQALRQGAASMVEDFIMADLKVLEHWIMTEIAKTSAAVAGDEVRAAAHDAAAAQGSAADVAAGSKSIINDAYKAAAATYASVAKIPYVGYILAPFAAAGAFAAVAAFDVLSAEGGAWTVNEGMAMLHEKESVLPAHIATPMREFFEDGNQGQAGGTTHLHVNNNVTAVNAKGVVALLKNRSTMRHMAKAYQNHLTLNPRARGHTDVTIPTFPTFPGLTYPVKKTIDVRTTRIAAQSGRQFAQPLWPYPVYHYEIDISVLRASPTFSELQTFQGFINALLTTPGQLFIWVDPDDSTVTSQYIGTGDGTTTLFQAMRTLGGFAEPVTAVLDNQVQVTSFIDDGLVSDSVGTTVDDGLVSDAVGTFVDDGLLSDTHFYVGGVEADATIFAGGSLSFSTPPGNGSAITWTGSFGWLSQPDEDTVEMGQFMFQLYEVQQFTFTTARPNA